MQPDTCSRALRSVVGAEGSGMPRSSPRGCGFAAATQVPAAGVAGSAAAGTGGSPRASAIGTSSQAQPIQ